MAYKDEYEVARLATRNGSEERMRALFDGEVKIVRQLHPPTMRRLLKGKIGFGKGLRPALVLLSRLKGLTRNRLRHLRAYGGAALGTRTDWLVLRVDRRGLAGTNRRKL